MGRRTESSRKPRANEVRVLDLELVYPNPDQPRKLFDVEKLQELADSIREHGLLQPIRVRPDGEGRFMIVLGERRWRAHKLAGIAKIPATVVDMSDDELADAAIVENMARADITPLEEAMAFQRRLDSGIAPEELARRLGLKQVWRITERTALLKLAPEYRDALEKRLLTPSQGFEMSRLGPGYQRLLFKAIAEGRCKSYQELRVVTATLLEAEKRAGRAAAFSLSGEAEPSDQVSMFSSHKEPTREERETVTRMEGKIQKVVDLLQGGFKDNEVVIAAKVSPRNADLMAEKLELIEKQLAKLRLGLRAAVAAKEAS
ncbi:MAG: putative chromosome partitioning protein ParB [Polyangiaceae bacterium]